MIVRVCIRGWAIKGKDTGMGGQVTLAPFLLKKKPMSKTTPPMSADPNTPLFEFSDGDDIMYEDDPAMTQVKANLMAVECM